MSKTNNSYFKADSNLGGDSEQINKSDLELRLAVIKQTIKDLASYKPNYIASARAWINAKGKENVDFSFVDICNSLNIQPDYMSKKIYEKADEIKEIRNENYKIRKNKISLGYDF